MQIKLNYVGLIKDSTIALNGLTVITGKNNSGKTTVGKTLYALLDAVCNLRQKAQMDRSAYILKNLGDVKDTLTGGVFFPQTPERTASFPNHPELNALLTDTVKGLSYPELVDYLSALEQELKKADNDLFTALLNDAREMVVFEDEQEYHFLVASNQEVQRNALTLLERTLEELKKDHRLINFARESINQSLRVEFNGQVQPARVPGVTSAVELSESGGKAPVYFRLSLVNNSVINDGEPVFFRVPFKRVYMIDDPFILDAPPVRAKAQGYNAKKSDTFFNPNRVQVHSRRLRQAVVNSRPVNIFEQTLLNDSLKSIKAQIDGIIPGTFDFSSDGEYYVENGTKIRIGNLATGSKMFSIIKLLLERGRIDADTMLILDEPEAHLHPQWQNAFAEIIVLLVKDLKVNVLLTTHSPNFMLALDANMRKHGVSEQTNFYQTDVLEDGFVHHHCVNDDLGQIYDDFLQYLSEMKMLRDRYMYPYGEGKNEEESK